MPWPSWPVEMTLRYLLHIQPDHAGFFFVHYSCSQLYLTPPVKRGTELRPAYSRPTGATESQVVRHQTIQKRCSVINLFILKPTATILLSKPRMPDRISPVSALLDRTPPAVFAPAGDAVGPKEGTVGRLPAKNRRAPGCRAFCLFLPFGCGRSG